MNEELKEQIKEQDKIINELREEITKLKLELQARNRKDRKSIRFLSILAAVMILTSIIFLSCNIYFYSKIGISIAILAMAIVIYITQRIFDSIDNTIKEMKRRKEYLSIRVFHRNIHKMTKKGLLENKA